jgi:uncharacterized damage-inducible protein DinB
MSAKTLLSLFKYKAWADAELLTLLAVLPASYGEQLHTCLRTLNHIRVVDALFRSRLAGEPAPFDATNPSTTPSLEELRQALEASDIWYLSYVASIKTLELAQMLAFKFTDNDQGQMTREEVLMHVSIHGAYHRGNVGQILKSIAIAPPRDVFTRFLHIDEPARRPT